jgi:hypothetical protein
VLQLRLNLGQVFHKPFRHLFNFGRYCVSLHPIARTNDSNGQVKRGK